MLKEHNKVTLSKVIPVLKATHRVAIVQATGTGKSYLTMAIIDSMFKDVKVLYLIPKSVIAESLVLYPEWPKHNVDFMTYTSLMNKSNEDLDKLVKDYTCIICDEFHHVGAEKWSRNIKYLYRHAKYMVGLSATNIRYLDNNRDMADELFEGNVVYGPSLLTAIKQGILPNFEYYAMIGEKKCLIEDLKQVSWTSPYKEVANRLRLSLQAEKEFKVRFRKRRNPNIKKWVLFLSGRPEFKGIENKVEEWFGEPVRVFKIFSGMPRKKVMREIKEFSECTELSVICSIDILSEGVHVEGVGGVIMMRKTSSKNVFLQQIGRALSASTTVTPQIFDVMETYANFKSTRRYLVEPTDNDGTESIESISELFIIDDMLIAIDDLLANNRVTFTQEQDDFIRKHYPVNGPNGYTGLKGITKAQYVKRAKELGVSYSNRWSAEEDFIIKKYFPKEGTDCYTRLTGRTPDACRVRAYKLNVKFIGGWGVREDVYLLENYPRFGEACFDNLAPYTVYECRKAARRLNLM